MLFPLSYETSLPSVMYLRLEKGDVQQGETEGELLTASSTVATSCTCAPC